MIIAGKDRCIKCMQPLIHSGACSCCGFNESEYVASASALKPGDCLNNRYFIGCVIGQGGFGITYSAWDIMLAVKVAIKEYYPAGMVGRGGSDNRNTEVIVQNNEYQSRYDKGLREFLREARTLAQFSQLRGIVAIRDFFGENNTAYIVMEYVEGIPVSSYVKQNGPFTGEQLLEKMEPILASLDIVHELGYLHRDISANNIMYMTDGQLKLIDFGAARMIENEETTITVSVKRGYSPSEQYMTRGNLGPWTDVYSVCATMYYMLTGKVPDDSIERVIEDRLEPLADIESVNLDKNIKLAIDKGMAVKDENRFRRIRELYKVMYPDKDDKIERITFFGEQSTEHKHDGNKRKKTFSRTLLKNELDDIIKTEKLQKQHKRRNVIIGVIIAAVVIFLCIAIYTIRSTKEGEALSSSSKNTAVPTGTFAATPDSTKSKAPEMYEEPTEEPEQKTTAEPTKKPVKKTHKPTKEPVSETTIKPTPKVTAKPSVKNSSKKPSKGDLGDDSVGTLDGL